MVGFFSTNFLVGKVRLIKSRYFYWCALLLCASLPSCLIERNTVKFGIYCFFLFGSFLVVSFFFTWVLALLMVLWKVVLSKTRLKCQICFVYIVCIVWGLGCFFTEFIYCM